MARKTRMDEMKKDLQKTAAEARTQLMAVVGATDLAVEKIRVAQEHFVQVARERKTALLGQRQQGPVGLLGAGVACRNEAQRAHRALTNEGQPVQRPGMAQAVLTEQAIHQQQTPAVRQTVGDQARKAMQMGRKTSVGIRTQLEVQGRQFQALRQGFGRIFEEQGLTVIGQPS